ncbi:hypothetical protein [Peromfec virus RodF5_17]|uniref:Uncharacterized protein n=1 Tax=Peromfec virus RodF5_17 TaxID=2929338 RepID=A0A976N2I3_9VIRU|nr:hypothetical protein [Peromfec virus RodF5_17]
MSEKETNPMSLGIKHGRPFRSSPVSSSVVPVYKLSNPDREGIRRLVQTGERDIQELIQSGYESSFDYILDRFLDGNDIYGLGQVDSSEMIDNQDFLLDALDVSAEYVEMMEQVREEYDLSPDLSYSQIREQLQILLEFERKKGGIVNETQTQNQKDSEPETPEPSKEQSAVPDDSTQSGQ